MNIKKFLNKIPKIQKYKTTAIILSAGEGKRMENDYPKQMIEIKSIPIIIRTLQSFDKSSLVDDIVLVIDNNKEWYENNIKKYEIQKKITIVQGGETRYDSMQNGLFKVSDDSDYVCIHDGVRCLIKPTDIDQIIKIAHAKKCCIAIQKSTDTLKKVDENGIIVSSLNRNKIYRAQTPQVFNKNILLISIANNKLNKGLITDDSILVEKMGYKVHTYDCGDTNIKITTKRDLKLAEEIITSESENKNEL